MVVIKKKKQTYPINNSLKYLLKKYNRYVYVPIYYKDLLRVESSTTFYDNNNNDTLWQTIIYRQEEIPHIHNCLKKIYSQLKAYGDMSLIQHLNIERIDLCSYGNTNPFRIKIVNTINDNFDYFYIKNADASRVYGLELEDILSPNKISYLVYDQTLIEEHVSGIPGDMFIENYLNESTLNRVRFIKEFIKFNERCLVRLLGDMHSSNFVIDITPDFEEVTYRIRPIDFDQQCYEGNRSIYMPQYFKQNNAILELGYQVMNNMETVKQYQQEERFLITKRATIAISLLKELILSMQQHTISPYKNIVQLRQELAEYYKTNIFLQANNMGKILEMSLSLLFRR